MKSTLEQNRIQKEHLDALERRMGISFAEKNQWGIKEDGLYGNERNSTNSSRLLLYGK